MMTRKDYVAVSNILKEYRQAMPIEDYVDLCSDFGKYMAYDNPRFDAVKFIKACDISEIEYPKPKPASEHLSLP